MAQQGVQGFLDWLKMHEPFYYDVVKARVLMDNPNALGGLGFWASIGNALSTIGGAVAQAAPAYIQYKQSNDLVKLEKAKLDVAKKQLSVPQQSTPPTLPTPDNSALTEILQRLTIAQNNGIQPPTDPNRTAFINPNNIPTSQYQQVVYSTANNMSWLNNPSFLIGGGAALIALLLLLKRRR